MCLPGRRWPPSRLSESPKTTPEFVRQISHPSSMPKREAEKQAEERVMVVVVMVRLAAGLVPLPWLRRPDSLLLGKTRCLDRCGPCAVGEPMLFTNMRHNPIHVLLLFAQGEPLLPAYVIM